MTLKTALNLHDMGISVVPIIPGTKMFDAKAMSSRGYTLKDLKNNLPTIADLENWFTRNERRLAIICKNIICLDFDNYPVYSQFKKKYNAFSYTWTVRTPRGFHLYYQVENNDVGHLKCDWPMTEIKYNSLAVITAGEGYETIKNSLYTTLKIRDAMTLPIVKSPPTAPHSLRSLGILDKEKRPETSFFISNPNERSECGVSVANVVLITDYLADLGHTIRKSGKGYITNCPFPDNHKNGDANPSFWIFGEDRQVCNCFNPDCASDKPMDYIALYARINDISNSEAYKMIYNIKPRESTKDRRIRLKKERQRKEMDKALVTVTRLMNR